MAGSARGARDGVRDGDALELADAIVSMAAALIVVLDPSGRITRFNRACERATGYREEEVLGECFDVRLVPPDAAEGVRGVLARLRASEEPVPHENEWVTRGGERRLIVWSNAALLDEAGEVAHVIASGIDVTDARRAERARQAAETRFRAAFEHAPIGVALVGAAPPWCVEDANPALCRLLGAPREALAGRPFASLLETGQHESPFAALGAAGAGHPSAELRLRGMGGEDVWVQVSAARAPLPGRGDQFVVHLENVTERRRQEAQLRHLADHDPLTGLLNRRRFAEDLEQTIRVGQRYGEPTALLTLDLDHFKAVNDLYGHAAGDALLVRVGQVMRERLRESDAVARLGGDEFAVLLPRLDGPAAASVAGDLMRHLARTATITLGGVAVHATASVGIASVDPGETATGQDLLVEADVALYEAKAAGRNRSALARAPAPSPRVSEAA